MKYTITLDDDPLIARFIQKVMHVNSLPFTSASALIREAPRYDPSAVFIDLNLESNNESGIETIQPLKQLWPSRPLIVITSNPKEDAVLEALSLGADDFIMKPLRSKELIARIQARQRDYAQNEAKVVRQYGDVSFHLLTRTLMGPRQKSVFLPPLETNIFLCLVEANGSLVLRETLKHRCWGMIKVSDRALDRKIHELRKLLTEVHCSVILKTIYGHGFILEA